jgi:hypothetical protein
VLRYLDPNPANWQQTQTNLLRFLTEAKDLLSADVTFVNRGGKIEAVRASNTVGGGAAETIGTYDVGVSPDTIYREQQANARNGADIAARLATASAKPKASIQQSRMLAKDFGQTFKAANEGAIKVINDPKYREILDGGVEALKTEAAVKQGMLSYLVARLNDPVGVLSNQDVAMSSGETLGSMWDAFEQSLTKGGKLSDLQVDQLYEMASALYTAQSTKVIEAAREVRINAKEAGVDSSLMPIVTPGWDRVGWITPDGQVEVFKNHKDKLAMLGETYDIDISAISDELAAINRDPELIPEFAAAYDLTVEEALEFLDGY